jgi:ABC-type phosphate transport system substrate-binding protein
MKAFPTLTVVLVLGLVVFGSTVAAGQSRPSPPYRVIVNPKNPATSIPRAFLQDAFLKKVRHWSHDKVIQPVDLAPASAVRSSFTDEVLGRSVAAVRAYWQQRIFSGRDVPPPELTNDERVIEYVLKHEEAIGYVSGATPLGGAKPVSVSR